MNIPTAQEFIKSTELVVKFDNTNGCILEEELPNLLKNFAKLHVEAALKEASEQAYAFTSFDDKPLVSKLSILNSYPLTNIE
jgi:hypothetical protein